MADTIVGRTCLLLWPALDQKERVDLLASVMMDWAFLTPFVLVGGLLPYGRYSNNVKGKLLFATAKIGWILQVSIFFVFFYAKCFHVMITFHI